MKKTNSKWSAPIFLAEELARRCRLNPRYSLRAFALELGLNASALSLILAGRRVPSSGLAEQIALRLGMDSATQKKFLKHSLEKKPPKPKQEQSHIQATAEIELDQFATISEWYHFAILSLIETDDFVPETKWIASRLGISAREAKDAVSRMVRLGLLATKGKKWKQVGAPLFIENDRSTIATKAYQRQVLEKALVSLYEDPFERREVTSVTMAINPKNVAYARKEIKKFLFDLMTRLEEKGYRSEVYNLSMQIYPTSKVRNIRRG